VKLPFYKDSSFWAFAAFCVVMSVGIGACTYTFEQDRAEWKAKQDAHKAHIRSTCKLLERNRPGKSGTYDTYQCGDVVEWVKRGWDE
jgi:hypothetical protein